MRGRRTFACGFGAYETPDPLRSSTMADVLELLVAPLIVLLAPLAWARAEPLFTRSSRLRSRISDHQALAEKLPPGSEAATNLQAEIDRQVNELVHYWGERRSKAAKSEQGQPVREHGRTVTRALLSGLVAMAFGAAISLAAPLISFILNQT